MTAPDPIRDAAIERLTRLIENVVTTDEARQECRDALAALTPEGGLREWMAEIRESVLMDDLFPAASVRRLLAMYDALTAAAGPLLTKGRITQNDMEAAVFAIRDLAGGEE